MRLKEEKNCNPKNKKKDDSEKAQRNISRHQLTELG